MKYNIFKKKEPKEELLNDPVIENEEAIQDEVPVDFKNESILLKLPSNLVVGYYEGMTTKGLKEYINGYVFKYFNAPNVTYYKIVKYNAGHLFEIHDGDSKSSFLKKIIDTFNNGENIIFIKTQNRIAKVSKHLGKIDTYLLPESESLKHPDAILPEKGKMKPIVTTGFGFVSFGIAMAFMGITSLFLSFVFKNVLNKPEDLNIPKQNIELPSSYIEKLPNATSTNYISKVWYENGKWNKNEKSIKTPEMEQIESIANFVSKVQNYKIFVEKCFNKINSFNECSDDNVFLDKIAISPLDNVQSLSLKDGTINIEFNHLTNEKENFKVEIVPTSNNQNIIWNMYCNDMNLLQGCMIKDDIKIEKKVQIGSPVINVLTDVMTKDAIDKKLESSKTKEAKSVKPITPIKSPIVNELHSTTNPLDKITKTVIQMDKNIDNKVNVIEVPKIISPMEQDIINAKAIKTKNDDLKMIEINKLVEKAKATKPLDKNVPETLNLNNIPENILVE